MRACEPEKPPRSSVATNAKEHNVFGNEGTSGHQRREPSQIFVLYERTHGSPHGRATFRNIATIIKYREIHHQKHGVDRVTVDRTTPASQDVSRQEDWLTSQPAVS